MKKVTISIYELDELQKSACERAIKDHGQFLDSEPEEFEDENGNLVCEYYEHTEDEIIESIHMNEYLFFADGKLAGRNIAGKSGKIELKFHGETIEIE